MFIPIVVGVVLLRYLTTRYRITNGQIELRKGLLNKQLLATPADRVRTVDVTSSPIHRLLGLGKVELGTAGTGHGDRLVLDALTLPEARHLREELIHLRQAAAQPTAVPDIPAGSTAPPPTGEPYALDAPPVASPPEAVAPTETELLRLDPRWARYAPVTPTWFVSALAIFGFASQYLRGVLEPGMLTEAFDWIGDYAWWVDSHRRRRCVLVVVTVLAVIGHPCSSGVSGSPGIGRDAAHHAVAPHQPGESSIEEKRIRGVEVGSRSGCDWSAAGGGTPPRPVQQARGPARYRVAGAARPPQRRRGGWDGGLGDV